MSPEFDQILCQLASACKFKIRQKMVAPSSLLPPETRETTPVDVNNNTNELARGNASEEDDCHTEEEWEFDQKEKSWIKNE